MLDNLEFSKEWLTKKLIEARFREIKENKATYVKITEFELFKLVLSFLELNDGGWKKWD